MFAKRGAALIMRSMFRRLLPASAAPLALFLAACGTGGYVDNHPSGTGPFDSRGNYVEAWADDPTKWNGRSVPTPASNPAPERQVAQAPAISPTPAPAVQPTVTTVSQPKPKPKPTPPRPTTRSHTVRKGDTLYGLAKKYGTTVSAIQKANALRGTTIRLGQTLKIPR